MMKIEKYEHVRNQTMQKSVPFEGLMCVAQEKALSAFTID